MAKALDIKASDFKKEVLESEIPVLVDFWAPWCGPCRMMAPVLDELSSIMVDKIKVAKIDTDESENQDLANEYDIQSIPNMKLFKNGKVVGEFIGMRKLEELKQGIDKLI
ncbi:MAG: thioredoxin [bacterium]